MARNDWDLSPHDVAASVAELMIDCAWDQSVPTSVAITTAANPARRLVSARVIPYSARSCPESSAIHRRQSLSISQPSASAFPHETPPHPLPRDVLRRLP